MTVSMFIPLLKKRGFENFATEGMHLKCPSCSRSEPVHLREGQMKDTNTQLPALYPPLEEVLQGRLCTLLPAEYPALVMQGVGWGGVGGYIPGEPGNDIKEL